MPTPPPDDATRTDFAEPPTPTGPPDGTLSFPPADPDHPTPVLDSVPPSPEALRWPSIPGYELEAELGRGGMGAVYKARDRQLNRPVALKVLLAGRYLDPAARLRFATEARAVAAGRHPNVVEVYEVGEHDGLPYLVLEYCAGGSLAARARQEAVPPRQAAELVEPLARAMHAAHAAGVIHRDLKPANVLLDEKGTPKVTDFGLARQLADESGFTRTGAVMGTPSYMAPEQALGRTKEVGPHSDQYSLGATLYDLLTGRPPFKGTSVEDTLEQVRTRDPLPPTQLQPGCPKDLETICLKTLSKDPAKRYADCAAFADDLRAYLDGRPITARPVGSAEKLWRWAKRNPRVAALTAAVAVLLLVIGTGGAAAAVVFDEKKREAVGLAKRESDAHALAEEKREVAEKALAAEAAARKDEAEQYAFARETAVKVAIDVPDLLRQAVFTRAVQAKVQEVLGEAMTAQLARAGHVRGLPERGVMIYHQQLGELLRMQGKQTDARKHLETARDISARLLAAETREVDKAKGNHAVSLVKLALQVRDLEGILGHEKALVRLREAERLRREVAGAPTTGEIPPAEAKANLADVLNHVAETYRRLQRYDLARPPAEEALALRKAVVDLTERGTPAAAAAQKQLADAHVEAGKVRRGAGDEKGAEEALVAGAGIYRRLVQTNDPNLQDRVDAAKAAREAGDFLLMRGRLAEAEPHHRRDLELMRSLLTIVEVRNAQRELGDAYYRSATLAHKMGERDDALRLYRKCRELRVWLVDAEPADTIAVLRLAAADARLGDHAAAAAGAEKSLRRMPHHITVAYDAACAFALCAAAAADPAEKKAYTARTLEVMDTLVGRLKFTDANRLATDPDLEGLKGEVKFQELLKVAEAGKKKE
jgi:serine/threonine-protein kinase